MCFRQGKGGQGMSVAIKIARRRRIPRQFTIGGGGGRLPREVFSTHHCFFPLRDASVDLFQRIAPENAVVPSCLVAVHDVRIGGGGKARKWRGVHRRCSVWIVTLCSHAGTMTNVFPGRKVTFYSRSVRMTVRLRQIANKRSLSSGEYVPSCAGAPKSGVTGAPSKSRFEHRSTFFHQILNPRADGASHSIVSTNAVRIPDLVYSKSLSDYCIP